MAKKIISGFGLMKKILIYLLLIAIIAFLVTYAMWGMFRPHTYNWRTGMPSLEDQVIKFQQANKRWPKDYNDLAFYLKQITTNFVPESYDRIDFATKPDGNLEIDVYTFNTRTTNRITLKK